MTTPAPKAGKYFVLYGDHSEWFVCTADDATHAAEQCYNYTKNDQIHGVWHGIQDDSWVTPQPQ